MSTHPVPRKQTFNPAELAKFGGLALLARRMMDGELSGAHRSPHKGYSVEFAEHRLYYPGDELRKIDWRAFGKTDRYFIKQYENETNLRCLIVVDASASMGFRGRVGPSKWVYAQQLAACMSYLLLGQNDLVGLILHDAVVRATLPPKSNRNHLFQILQCLQEATPGQESSLGDIWQSLATTYFRRRGLVIFITDGHDDTDKVKRALRYLHHAKQDVILLQVLTKEEAEFPFREPALFRDLEQQLPTATVDVKRLRSEYLQNFTAHQDGLQRVCSELSFDRAVFFTHEPLSRSLAKMLQRRQQKR